jgi:hypothetical protein
VDTWVEPSGALKTPLVLGPGVEVSGRVLKEWKPVAGIQMGLRYADGRDPKPLTPLEVKTNANGFFRIPHVLAGTEFWAYSKLGSVAGGGTIVPIHFETGADGLAIDLGECRVELGRTLAGRVVCSDGRRVPAGTVIWGSCPRAGGVFSLELGGAGRFEFKGLPPGEVNLHLSLNRVSPATPYHVSGKNKCLHPNMPFLEGQLERDITDLTILLEPGPDADGDRTSLTDIDPTVRADFNDAKAGPITGVPPRP